MIPAMSPEIEKTLKSLKKNRFDTRFVQTAAEAREMILEMIPQTACVGNGDSVTMRQIGILEELVTRGNKVINPFTPESTAGMLDNAAMLREHVHLERMAFSSDVFLTSANAITEDGKIVSIDRAGNRVAGMIFGAPKVILPVGRNKITKDVHEAIHRIKNVIAPAHAKQKQRRSPCVVTGKCSECDSPDRLCNITIILEGKPMFTDLSVILINEDLGLGWDPTWDEKRISEIRSNYANQMWLFSTPK
ncbi:lactate utilization protein [Chloroflexota bacterium]